MFSMKRATRKHVNSKVCLQALATSGAQVVHGFKTELLSCEPAARDLMIS